MTNKAKNTTVLNSNIHILETKAKSIPLTCIYILPLTNRVWYRHFNSGVVR